MKNLKVLGLILCLCVTVQSCVFAKSNTTEDNDIIIPSLGVSLDENGKPNAWVGMPKNPNPTKEIKTTTEKRNFPLQKGNRLFVGPANGVGSYTNSYDDTDSETKTNTTSGTSKPNFSKPEGFSFHLQQPTIQVGR